MKFLWLFSHSPQPQQGLLAKEGKKKKRQEKKMEKGKKLKPDSTTQEPNALEPSQHPEQEQSPGQTPCVTNTTTRLALDKMALFKSPRQKWTSKFPGQSNLEAQALAGKASHTCFISPAPANRLSTAGSSMEARAPRAVFHCTGTATAPGRSGLRFVPLLAKKGTCFWRGDCINLLG